MVLHGSSIDKKASISSLLSTFLMLVKMNGFIPQEFV